MRQAENSLNFVDNEEWMMEAGAGLRCTTSAASGAGTAVAIALRPPAIAVFILVVVALVSLRRHGSPAIFQM